MKKLITIGLILCATLASAQLTTNFTIISTGPVTNDFVYSGGQNQESGLTHLEITGTDSAGTSVRYYSMDFENGLLYVYSESGLSVYELPDMAVTGPTTAFPAAFSTNFVPPVSDETEAIDGTAQIAEWTRQNDPGDTMALTGEEFDGDFAGFYYYSEDGAGFGDIQRLDGRHAAVTLPSTLTADDFYLMWPMNPNGFGYPVGINQAKLDWIGFTQFSTGEVFYAYGSGLSLGGDSCWIWNDTEQEWLESIAQNPYRATFVCPATWANGEHELYAHNGHGKEYGFSLPQTVTVVAKYERSGTVLNIDSYGGDGTDGLPDNVAYEAMRAASSAGDVLGFSAGTYHFTNDMIMSSSRHIVGAGSDQTFLVPHESAPSSFKWFNYATGGSRTDTSIEDMTFVANTNGPSPGSYVQSFYLAKDVLVKNVRYESKDALAYTTGFNVGAFSLPNAERITFTNCFFEVSGENNLAGAPELRFIDCTWVGHNDINHYISGDNASNADFTDNVVSNYSLADTSSGEGWAKGRWIAMAGGTFDNLYVSGLMYTNGGPRQVTPWVNDITVTNVTAEHDEQLYPNFGTGYLQEFYLDFDIPASRSLTNFPSSSAYADKMYFTTINGGVTNANGYRYITEVDTDLNYIQVFSSDWTTPYDNSDDELLVNVADGIDANSGEIILYEATPSWQAAEVVSATSTNMTFDHVEYAWIKTVGIVKGRGLGQVRDVVSINTNTDVVVVSPPFSVIPDTTSVVNFGTYAKNVTLYDNYFDGRLDIVTNYSAVTALNVYGNGTGVVVDGNTMHELGSAVAFFAEGYDDGYPSYSGKRSAQMFNFVANNTIDSGLGGLTMSERVNDSYPADYVTVGLRSKKLPNNSDGVRHLAHTFRNNTVANMYGKPFGMLSASVFTNSPYNLITFQDNVFSNYVTDVVDPVGVTTTNYAGYTLGQQLDTVANTVLVGNSFYGSAGQTGYTIHTNHFPALVNNTWSGFDADYGGWTRPTLNFTERTVNTNASTQPVTLQGQGSETSIVTSVLGSYTNAPETSQTVNIPSTVETNFVFYGSANTQTVYVVASAASESGGGGAPAPDPVVTNLSFVTLWETPTNNTPITMPVLDAGQTVNFSLVWEYEDGTFISSNQITSVTDPDLTQTIPTAGVCRAYMTGDVWRWRRLNPSDTMLKSVENLGDCSWVSFADFLNGSDGVTNFTAGYAETSTVDNFYNMLRDISTLATVDLTGMDIGSATTMAQMFQWSSPLTSLTVGDTFGISEVTTMVGFVQYRTIQTADYDALWIAMKADADANGAQTGVSFHGGSSTCTASGAGEAARQHFVTTYSWSITDGDL